jgi:hypothetical protein
MALFSLPEGLATDLKALSISVQEGLREHNRHLGEIASEMRALRQILEPHRLDGGTAFRGGERHAPSEVDASWLGGTDEMAQVIREELTRYLGHPPTDADEREFLERGHQQTDPTPEAQPEPAAGPSPSTGG